MDIYWSAVAQLIYENYREKYRAASLAHQMPVWSDLEAFLKEYWVKQAQSSAEVLSNLPR